MRACAELSKLLKEDFKSRLPTLSKVCIPEDLMESISRFPYDHHFEFCGYFVGEVQERIIHVKCFEWCANFLRKLVSNSQVCLEYLEVAGSPIPPSKPVQKKLFWFMLKDRNLYGKALEVLEGQLALENFQELIHREAKVSCIPSNKIIIGEKSWYYEHEKEILSRSEAYYRMHLHSHSLGNPILPSSADLYNIPETSSIAQIETGKVISMYTYKSSGPGRTIYISFFPINVVKQSLEIRLDKPKIILIEADIDYEDWRRHEKLGREYVFSMYLTE